MIRWVSGMEERTSGESNSNSTYQTDVDIRIHPAFWRLSEAALTMSDKIAFLHLYQFQAPIGRWSINTVTASHYLS